MYDKAAYIQSVIERNLGRSQTIRDADESAASAECGAFSVRGAVRKRESGCLEYARFLKGLIWYIKNLTKPSGIRCGEFLLLLPLVKHLVSRGEIPQAALKDFEAV